MPNNDPVPAILGALTHSRLGADPPVFRVELGARRYFAVEVASDPALFDPANTGTRTNDNFFASWQADLEGPVETTTYAIPAAVWSRLRFNDKLYYRVLSVPAKGSWDGVLSSSAMPALQRAPSLTVTSDQPRPTPRSPR